MATAPDEPERPVLDRGDFYIFDDEDIADIATEVFAHVREYEDIDDDRAEKIADQVYEIMTGEWLTDE